LVGSISPGVLDLSFLFIARALTRHSIYSLSVHRALGTVRFLNVILLSALPSLSSFSSRVCKCCVSRRSSSCYRVWYPVRKRLENCCRVENATLTDSHVSGRSVDRVENGCTASVALETFVLRKSTESPAFVKLRCVPCGEKQPERENSRS
jgi:hypothetical protein